MSVYNHFAYLACRRPGATVYEASVGLVVDSGLDCDTFNVIVSDAAGLDVTVEDAAATAGRFGGRAFSWWVGPNAAKQTGSSLQALGLIPSPPEPNMSANLTRLRADEHSDVITQPVNTTDKLCIYASILAANWSPPDENVTRFYQDVAPAILAQGAPLRLFLGYLDNEPVGTAELAFSHDGVAGLYNVATLRSHRRRGVGRALTQAAMRAAKQARMSAMQLQSSEEGYGLYQEAGFRTDGFWTEFRPAVSG
jgi:ribosomal protein S18 acetylase RimI-like enzyme